MDAILLSHFFFLFFLSGFGPARRDMQGQAAVQEVKAEHGDQQGAHVEIGRREPIQVSVQQQRALHNRKGSS